MSGGAIGRYRLIRRVGAGGMGEVYEAYDDQLQRPVAIKGLFAGAVDPTARERLKREALATAALSHPGIAHVYEIISEDDRDWVVMEYIEGRTLADVLRSGALPPEDVARIGETVARALFAAHQRGIIHRDVKAENVMITPAGHVKVLDFGLAKRIVDGDGLDPRLTIDGAVLGTSRAMSPEQALGHPLDARSDVFSLGSLLYEMATGSPAFDGATAADTMVKVARAEHEPLGEVSPGFPAELAAVIERCLALDPGRRYPSAQEVAEALRRIRPTVSQATVAASAVLPSRQAFKRPLARALTVLVVASLALVALLTGWFGRHGPLTVAIVPTQSEGGGPAVGEAALAVYDAVTATLLRLDDLHVVSRYELQYVDLRSRPTAELARALGADELLESSIVQNASNGGNRIILSRVDGSNGHMLWSREVETQPEDLAELESAVEVALEDAYPGRGRSDVYPRRDFTEESLRTYLEIERRVQTGEFSADFLDEAAILKRVVALSPRFVEPIITLANLDRLLYDRTRRPEYLEQCRTLVARAELLGPRDPRVRRQHIAMDIAAGDTLDALRDAEALVELRKTDAAAWSELGHVLTVARRPEEARHAYRRAYELRPSAANLSTLGEACAACGELDEARLRLERALALEPESPAALASLAAVEERSGDLVAAERCLRRATEVHPDGTLVAALGRAFLYAGKKRQAIDAFRRAMALAPSDPGPAVGLADALLADGQHAAAGRAYAHALELADAAAKAGPASPRPHRERALCLAHLGRGSDAALAAHEAMRLDPADPANSFAAALVAAINGDTSASLAWSRTALAKGAARIWFGRAEFAGMRDKPGFEALFVPR